MSSKIKRILIACGSGLATETVIDICLTRLLNENGYEGKYQFFNYKLDDTSFKNSIFDFAIGTIKKPEFVNCPYIDGMSILTGRNQEFVVNEIFKLMNL